MISIFQPVNLTAKLTFWASLPIANENWSSATIALQAFASASKIWTPITTAVLNATATKWNALNFKPGSKIPQYGQEYSSWIWI